KVKSQTCTVAPPVISGSTIAPCALSSAFTLTANGSPTNTIGWYSFPYGGNAISTNSVFTTLVTSNSLTYYVSQSAGLSTASLTLPGHNSAYGSAVRGFYFIAPSSFIITGVRVPTDVNTGNFSAAILKMAA